MKIIFLDIDGCLAIPATKFQTFETSCCLALQKIITETDAQIVISSAWRHFDMQKVIDFLAPFVPLNLIIDKTPDLTCTLNGTRGREIQAWLDKHPDVESFIIIDDDTFDMQEFSSRIIETVTETGLTMRDAEKAIALLKKS